jgi:diguanylate cyclase (GGDEF)-like protein
MTRIWAKSALCATIAVMATQAISFSVRAVLGMPADHITLLMGLIIPIIITLPIALFVFRQTEKLDRAHAALLIANETLARKASHDHMTGLLNRESFFNQIDVLRLSPAGGTLLIIDADHFKKINDRFGHPTGDDALMRIASAITIAVRRGDIVGRIGGEEFGAFLVGADRQEAMQVAQRVRGTVEGVEFTVRGGERVLLTVSVGGAIADGEPALGDLMRQADGCLYEAKRTGRNRVIIESGLTVAA